MPKINALLMSHAHTPTGLTSSLDSLLKTTFQTELFGHDPSHISQTQETDMKPNNSSAADSTSQLALSKHDSIHMLDSTNHSRSMDKSTSTVPCDSTFNKNSKELNQSENSQTSHHPMSSTSVDTSLEPAYKAIIHCHDKLVTALSNDILTVSGVLVAKEFIPAELSSKMLLPN